MDCTILPLEILRPVSPFSLLVLNSLLRLYSTCLCFLVKSGGMKIPLWAAGHGSAISSAKQGKSGSIYYLVNN